MATTDLPAAVMYTPDANAFVCATCGSNRPLTYDGLLDTLACHDSLATIDREQIPPVQLGLTLTPEEIADAPINLRLLCALQIIANIGRKRYHRHEIDLVHDSPSDVLSRVGIDSNDIHTLNEEGLITVDRLHRYSYYTVTPTGRELLREPHRKSVEWGHSRGDNTETLLHAVMVTALTRYVRQEYVSDPDSPITRVVQYYELTASDNDYGLDAGTRFDLVGLDDSEQIRLVGEAERSNNDRATAAIEDYDKMAAVSPDHALWVVSASQKGHEAVIQPLSDPEPDLGKPRIPSYSDSTRISTISGIDTPGLTGIFTLNELRKQLTPPALTPDSH